MKRTIGVEMGRCGWGYSAGLEPEIRIGWFRFWTCPGSVKALLSGLRIELAEAARELRRKRVN